MLPVAVDTVSRPVSVALLDAAVAALVAGRSDGGRRFGSINCFSTHSTLVRISAYFLTSVMGQ